jgi:xylose isomerase
MPFPDKMFIPQLTTMGIFRLGMKTLMTMVKDKHIIQSLRKRMKSAAYTFTNIGEHQIHFEKISSLRALSRRQAH